jgi:hypothetical protein
VEGSTHGGLTVVPGRRTDNKEEDLTAGEAEDGFGIVVVGIVGVFRWDMLRLSTDSTKEFTWADDRSSSMMASSSSSDKVVRMLARFLWMPCKGIMGERSAGGATTIPWANRSVMLEFLCKAVGGGARS